MSSKPFYLVSASPRRKELLNRLGINPHVIPMDFPEYLDPSLSPEDLTLSLAQQKMDLFLENRPDGGMVEDLSGLFALTADTIVHINAQHLGKPSGRQEAEKMLRLLSGKTHVVTTAFVLIVCDKTYKKAVSTQVAFNVLKDGDIDYYLDSDEWKDAAGAYKIQERGEILINWINGSWSNVMGLPISPIYAILRDNNLLDSL